MRHYILRFFKPWTSTLVLADLEKVERMKNRKKAGFLCLKKNYKIVYEQKLKKLSRLRNAFGYKIRQ